MRDLSIGCWTQDIANPTGFVGRHIKEFDKFLRIPMDRYDAKPAVAHRSVAPDDERPRISHRALPPTNPHSARTHINVPHVGPIWVSAVYSEGDALLLRYDSLISGIPYPPYAGMPEVDEVPLPERTAARLVAGNDPVAGKWRIKIDILTR
ncbi:hypothetical protein [Paraburkholderia sp. GAS38]|uniref:hypothetical protein n=1 Tax=Paraburkholderia sp. GAS38 TaxID=3035133 RepID=UPI003D19CB40